MWKDLTAHKDEVGVIDFDPFYNAQDFQIKNLSVGQAKIEASKASVPVSFTNYTAKESIAYLLVKQNDSWKIADIKYKNGDTLLKYFREDSQDKTGAKN